MGNTKVTHHYTSFTLLDLLAGFGGIYRLIGMYTALVAGYINRKVLMSKLIRGLYFMKKPAELIPAIQLNKNYNTANLMTTRVDFFNSCFKYSRNQK